MDLCADSRGRPARFRLGLRILNTEMVTYEFATPLAQAKMYRNTLEWDCTDDIKCVGLAASRKPPLMSGRRPIRSIAMHINQSGRRHEDPPLSPATLRSCDRRSMFHPETRLTPCSPSCAKEAKEAP